MEIKERGGRQSERNEWDRVTNICTTEMEIHEGSNVAGFQFKFCQPVLCP